MRSDEVGKFSVLVAVIMFALLMSSLFLPFGGWVPPVIVTVATMVALALLGLSLVLRE